MARSAAGSPGATPRRARRPRNRVRTSSTRVLAGRIPTSGPAGRPDVRAASIGYRPETRGIPSRAGRGGSRPRRDDALTEGFPRGAQWYLRHARARGACGLRNFRGAATVRPARAMGWWEGWTSLVPSYRGFGAPACRTGAPSRPSRAGHVHGASRAPGRGPCGSAVQGCRPVGRLFRILPGPRRPAPHPAALSGRPSTPTTRAPLRLAGHGTGRRGLGRQDPKETAQVGKPRDLLSYPNPIPGRLRRTDPVSRAPHRPGRGMPEPNHSGSCSAPARRHVSRPGCRVPLGRRCHRCPAGRAGLGHSALGFPGTDRAR
ncbi:hypothetical protein J2Z77_000712 [Streptomyces avidinii]|uniref:Uncharacterized protein n=1 Tax=Streptomyces avidinii TaxID=1895 RepID=A0ABS4KY51_STRAV|nr:hypothetical protein [Streptomyces avidinii]